MTNQIQQPTKKMQETNQIQETIDNDFRQLRDDLNVIGEAIHKQMMEDEVKKVDEIIIDEMRMVLCVRTDLGMSKGKMCAQCGHATLGAYRSIMDSMTETQIKWLNEWLESGEAKIAVKIDTLNEFLTVRYKAFENNIATHIVIDQGRTQIEKDSLTVLAIGPAPKSLIDKITGHLKLL